MREIIPGIQQTETIRLNMDYEYAQRFYKEPVVCEGIVNPKSVIGAIHARTRNKLDWIGEYGEITDGWKLEDTTPHPCINLSYDLTKNGEVILSTDGKLISGNPSKYVIGFLKEEVDALILGKIEVEVGGKYPVDAHEITEYSEYVRGKFRNAVNKFHLEYDGELYFATNKKDFDFFIFRLESLRSG